MRDKTIPVRGPLHRGHSKPIKILETEAESSSPSQSKIRGAFQSIKNVLEGVTGNLVASGIVALIRQLTVGI
jgi:hypothetical protein